MYCTVMAIDRDIERLFSSVLLKSITARNCRCFYLIQINSLFVSYLSIQQLQLRQLLLLRLVLLLLEGAYAVTVADLGEARTGSTC
jgi:hypothetical protein